METTRPDKDITRRTFRRILTYGLYILIPVILILLGWAMYSQHRQMIRIHNLSEDKAALVKEFTNLKEDFQRVKSLNAEYEEQITEDQNRIDKLIREIKYKAEDIEQYQVEITKLQMKLKNYLQRIDSLEITLIEKKQESQKIIANLKASKLSAYNVDTRVCITWKNVSTELREGLYYVNIYTDGYEIGPRAFILESEFLFF